MVVGIAIVTDKAELCIETFKTMSHSFIKDRDNLDKFTPQKVKRIVLMMKW